MTMPDLQTELKKLAAIKFDDDGDAVQEQPATQPANVSRTLWLFVKDNPGATAHDASLGTGIEGSSSSSLLSQMFHKGVLRRTKPATGGSFQYTVIDPDYVPLTPREALMRAVAAKEAKPRAKKAKAAPAVIPAADESIDALLNNMSIVKARALYDALKKIFGG